MVPDIEGGADNEGLSLRQHGPLSKNKEPRRRRPKRYGEGNHPCCTVAVVQRLGDGRRS